MSQDTRRPARPEIAPGAMIVHHRRGTPWIDESAYVAPGAVICGDVRIGAHSRVLFGAVVTAEGGPVEIGDHCIVMENAVVRGAPEHPTTFGDHVLVGPQAHLTGCVVEGDSRIATGAMVFNGARIGSGAEVEFHALVHVDTVIPPGTAVPMHWFAGGDPAELVPPSDWDRIRRIMGDLDYPGTVFGVGDPDTARNGVPDMARRYARRLGLHRQDYLLDPAHYPI